MCCICTSRHCDIFTFKPRMFHQCSLSRTTVTVPKRLTSWIKFLARYTRSFFNFSSFNLTFLVTMRAVTNLGSPSVFCCTIHVLNTAYRIISHHGSIGLTLINLYETSGPASRHHWATINSKCDWSVVGGSRTSNAANMTHTDINWLHEIFRATVKATRVQAKWLEAEDLAQRPSVNVMAGLKEKYDNALSK